MKRDVVGDRGVHFLRALQGTDITVFYQDLNLKYIWIGNVQGLLCFSVEITEKKKKEVNLHELLLEISHRSRNLLAIVQGLATQTLKTSNNHQELDHFNSRLQSLASSLDLVTKDSWDGIHVGLAIQELASSSVRTSGIKLNSERVHIHIGTDDGSILFQWKEHRPEAQSAQNAHNLDETILLKIAPRSVSGTADIVFEGGQLVYRLTIPQNDLL